MKCTGVFHFPIEGQLSGIDGFTGIHVLLVLGGLSLSKNSASRLTDGLDITLILLSGA